MKVPPLNDIPLQGMTTLALNQKDKPPICCGLWSYDPKYYGRIAHGVNRMLYSCLLPGGAASLNIGAGGRRAFRIATVADYRAPRHDCYHRFHAARPRRTRDLQESLSLHRRRNGGGA